MCDLHSLVKLLPQTLVVLRFSGQSCKFSNDFIDGASEDEWTPLLLAIDHCLPGVVKLLLDAGASK